MFVFLHHPRWLKKGYGDDWDRVHGMLSDAGNVKAVFAGHIHKMRYDGKRDGIEYFTLATIGGHQSGLSHAAGYLHQYHVVTVRKDGLNVASVPVGAVQDPRVITGKVSDAMRTLNGELRPKFSKPLAFARDLSIRGELGVRFRNPVDRLLELALIPESVDGRWQFQPDHIHVVVPAGESAHLKFRVRRDPSAIDRAFDIASLRLQADYLEGGLRFGLNEKRWPLPLDLSKLRRPAATSTENRALALAGGNDCAAVSLASVKLPDRAFTLEGWLNARAFRSRQGFLNNTESSGFGFFVNKGRPSWMVHLNGKYAEAKAGKARLTPGRWHHLAGVFTGKKVRLFVDGRLAAEVPAGGVRTGNSLPLLLGADVARGGRAVDALQGMIDEVRLSKGVRYEADFRPRRRLATDERTVLHYRFDEDRSVPWAWDSSRNAHHAWLKGGAHRALAPSRGR